MTSISDQTRLPVVLIALVALATGCSSNSPDDAKADTSSPDETSSSEGGDNTAEPDPADQAIAEEALLTLTDFPADWESVQPGDEDDDEVSKQDIADCVGVEYDELYDDTNASADSPDFTSPDDVEVSNTVGVARDEAWGANAFDIMSSAELRGCMRDEMQTLVTDAADEEDQDITVGEVTVNEMSFGSYGDASTAFRVTIPMESQGLTFEAKAEFIAVRLGRAQTLVTTFALGSGLAPEELAGYVEISVDRLEQTLAES